MKLFFFISLLPESIQRKYYDMLIKDGIINDDLWNEISCYLYETFHKLEDIESEVKEVLKNLTAIDKQILLDLIKINNIDLYDRITSKVLNFEDILHIKQELLKNVLEKYSTIDIYKATLASSPKVKDLIMSLMSHRDFNKLEIRSVPINDIVAIHNNIINDVNQIN